MNTKIVIEKQYLPWLALNGIVATPKVELAQWDPVPGFEPPLEIKWSNERGSKLDQPAELIASDILSGDGGLNGKMRVWLTEVVGCVGKNLVPLIDWSEWVAMQNPAPKPDGIQTLVGEKLSSEYVANFAVDQSRSYYTIVGAAPALGVYTAPDGKRYDIVQVTPFARWFRAL